MTKWISAALLLMLIALQYRLWQGDGGIAEVHQLESQLANQKQQVKLLQERNYAMEIEIQDLKNGLAAVEELARSQYGMIKEGEIFYHLPHELPDEGSDP